MRQLPSALVPFALVPFALAAGCGPSGTDLTGLSSFHVEITKVNGAAPPTKEAPLPANLGDVLDRWDFTIEARDPGDRLEHFGGTVRLSVRPGAVMGVEGTGAIGRNIDLVDGKASGTVVVTAVYGPTRLWIEDVGYTPAEPGVQAQCEDSDDNDGDVLADYPNDPGCAFADDDSEKEGTFAAGVSAPVQYALPRVSDVQGRGNETPYPYEGIEVKVDAPQDVVVTRVSSDGFYVTDLAAAEVTGGYNSLFAFNFNTPAQMRICDKATYLAGTVTDFFGMTELSFPSYRLTFPIEGKDECRVPEPVVLDGPTIADAIAMEKVESALVRVEGFSVSKKFGPKPVVDNVPDAEHSSCDLNGDGSVDFYNGAEATCADVCAADPDCTEWTQYSARGSYKLHKAGAMILVNTGTIPTFDPVAHKGQLLDAVTGTVRNFSGGSLNWTIETRCSDDLACGAEGCVPKPLSSKVACVRLRSLDDNDEGTN